MNTRFYNALVLLTNDDKTFTLIKGELHVEGNVIQYIKGTPVGAGADAIPQAVSYEQGVSVNAFDEERDMKGNLIMPGFKNAHTHTAMTFLRPQMN